MAAEEELNIGSIPATVVGAGLAGCEAAYQLARRGVPVRLVEMKPKRFQPAHKLPHCHKGFQVGITYLPNPLIRDRFFGFRDTFRLFYQEDIYLLQ